MAMSVGVTSDDVLARFLRSESAKRFYEDWVADPRRQTVIPRLLSHVSRFANVVSTNEVVALCRRIANDHRLHALANISSREGAIPEVRDWSPSYAFAHAFHFVMEDEGELVTFDEAIRHNSFRVCMWADIREHIERLISRRTNTYSRIQLERAMRWRIGLSYYALIKEFYVTALLREEGHAVRQHPLADSLFRTDFWLGETNVDLFLGNKRYRVEGRDNIGRKRSSADLLSDAVPKFSHLALTCPAENKFGLVYLPQPMQTVMAFSQALRVAATC